jgi:hypothetical protein
LVTKVTPLLPAPPDGVDFSRFKIQPRYVSSDTCVVTEDGVELHPHQGEGVWLFPMGNLAGHLYVQELYAAQRRPDSDGDDKLEDMVVSFRALNQGIANTVAAWNWTDWARRPLPQPNGDYHVIEALHESEISWLRTAIEGGVPAELKNDAAPSGATSTDTETPPAP